MSDALVATTFRFEVTLQRVKSVTTGPETIGAGGFQECTGLEMEMEVNEVFEGGRNNGVVQRAGRAKFPKLVLKRGMLHRPDEKADVTMWQWIQDVVGGVRPLRRYDGEVKVLGFDHAVAAHWRFERGLPAKVVGPQLNARTGEVAIEELHIAHEGLWLVTS